MEETANDEHGLVVGCWDVGGGVGVWRIGVGVQKGTMNYYDMFVYQLAN